MVAARADFFEQAAKKGYTVLSGPGALEASHRRAVAVSDEGFQLAPVMQRAIEILSRNRKGYFLMVEWDAHTDNQKAGLDRVVEFDKVIRSTASSPAHKDTLFLFTADHSFDLRNLAGARGKPLLETTGATKTEGKHTGEEVLVAAKGPGASRIRGYMDNTSLFGVMMSALGWKPAAAAVR